MKIKRVRRRMSLIRGELFEENKGKEIIYDESEEKEKM